MSRPRGAELGTIVADLERGEYVAIDGYWHNMQVIEGPLDRPRRSG